MIERLKELILNEQLSPGTFADAIGVQRSSLSHILNGRNNPSLDFVVKTLQKFPRINPEWFIMGTGPMYRETDKSTNQLVKELSIFDSFPEPPRQETIVIDKKVIEKEEVKPIKHDRFVDKVLIFYSDHTYDEYKKSSE